MGIFAYHIGKMDIPEEHREEYAQQVLELLRAGGMMTVEELRLYRKKIYLLSPPEFDEEGHEQCRCICRASATPPKGRSLG